MSEAVLCRSRATLWRRTTTGVLLLPPAASEPVRLAGAAALVWDLLEEPIAVGEATEILARACGEDRERIGPDVEAVVAELRQLGAAEEVGPATC